MLNFELNLIVDIIFLPLYSKKAFEDIKGNNTMS